jgi:hypothetical protein
MRIKHDDWMHQDFEEHPLRRPRRTDGWWVAAAAAVVAVVGVVAFLSVSPSAARLRGPPDRGLAEAPAASAAHRTQLTVAPAAGAAELAAQSRIAPHARATEAAAQAGAASANAAAQDATATSAVPQP